MNEAQRLERIPPYLFAEINKRIAAARARGVDVISLGIGDPDLPTPEPVSDALKKAVEDPANHGYPDYEGMPEFREAVADWYRRRHGVKLDPETETVALIGGKEGSLHLSLSYVNPGDFCLVPDPAYPTYATSTLMAGGIPHKMLLKEENGFLPDLSAIPRETARKARIMYLNYPNNPTSAVAGKDYYSQVVDFARENDVIVCSDNPYSGIGFDGYGPASFLEVPGAREVGVEFNSLSKHYNMTGWRIGMAVGNEDVIRSIRKVKSNVDSGIFSPVQIAGVAALKMPDSHLDGLVRTYQHRRDLVVDALRQIGLEPNDPKAAIYVWTKVPPGYTSAGFASEMIEKAGVVVAPGGAYGEGGEGYFRISLTVNDRKLETCLGRMKKDLNFQKGK